MDKKQFRPIFDLLAGAYPSQSFTERNGDAYYELLKDLPFQLVYMAAKSLLTDAGRDFPPKPGDIRARCYELRGLAPPPFALAWAEVAAAIQNTGRYALPEWSHPLIGRIITSSVWLNMCDAESLEIAQAQFRMAYEGAVIRYNAERLDPADVQEAKAHFQASLPDRNAPMRSIADIAGAIQADVKRRDERLAKQLPPPRGAQKWVDHPSEVRARHKQLREAEKPAR